MECLIRSDWSRPRRGLSQTYFYGVISIFIFLNINSIDGSTIVIQFFISRRRICTAQLKHEICHRYFRSYRFGSWIT